MIFEDHVVPALYVLASVCVVYKLAYLVRQAASLPNIGVLVVRFVAVFAGTLLVWRVVEVTDGKIAVAPVDIALQLAWCVILYLVINAIGRRKRVW